MFDLDVIGQEYDALIAAGLPPLTFALFDKRYLLPLRDLPGIVARETGETVEAERLPTLVEAGWLPALTTDNGDLGFPLYIPSRLGLYLQLERAGWSAAELAAAAEGEEVLVDEILVSPDTPYDDDDLALVRIGTSDEVESLRQALEHGGNGEDPDALRGRLAHAERTAAWLGATTLDALRPSTRAKVARHAHLLRAHFECVRLFMLTQDRALLERGYSFFVQTTRSAWDAASTPAWSFDGIDWAATLRRQAAVSPDDAPLPIRIPGLVLQADRITLAPRTTPAQYQAAWETHRVDEYLALLAARDGQRVCVRCLEPLPDGASPTRRFCSDACRNAEKAETYRRKHPERVKATQHRWRSA